MDKAIKEKKVKPIKMKAEVPKKAKKEKKAKSLERQKTTMGLLFVLPFMVGFILFYLPMIWESISLSFYKLIPQMGGGMLREFVGFQNYSWALFESTDPSGGGMTFVQVLWGSIGDLVLSVPSLVVFSLFMAIILNQKMRGRAVFRAIFFIPVIVSTGIIEYIEGINKMIQTSMEGTAAVGGSTMNGSTDQANQIVSLMDVSKFFRSMKVGQELVTYVTDMVNRVYDIVNRSGVQMLIFLAGLQSISPSIYESCEIDGATAWETFWKITFPMIGPMILVNVIYTVIDSFTSSKNTVMMYIDKVYTTSGGNVRATAMSWMYFLIVAVILLIIGGALSMVVFYQRKEN